MGLGGSYSRWPRRRQSGSHHDCTLMKCALLSPHCGLLAVCDVFMFSAPHWCLPLSAGQWRALCKSQGPKVQVRSGHGFCMENTGIALTPNTLCEVENGHFGMHMSALRKTHPEDSESSHKYQGGENTGEAKIGKPIFLCTPF